MNQITQRSTKIKSVLATVTFLATSFAHAASTNYEQSLQRGAVEDVTPQQKYRTAIREAGGGYKESLRDCVHAAGVDRRACTLEAKATYDRDMAEARMILGGREPVQARPRE